MGSDYNDLLLHHETFSQSARDEFQAQLKGASLTTAEILYHLPDYPSILQTFVWQLLDLPPKFPRLHQFLTYWDNHIEADLHQVRICHKDLICPAEYRLVDGEFLIH